MGVVSIRLAEQDERKLKRIADVEKKNLSEYCREKILNQSENMTEQINREDLEQSIENLGDRIENIEKAFSLTIQNISEQKDGVVELQYIIKALMKAILKDDPKIDSLITWAKESRKEKEKAR